MIRPPWCEPDWAAMEESVEVTLVIDIEGLCEWALSFCPQADAGVSAWRGAAMAAKTLAESWGSDFAVEFRRWDSDTVVELYYPSGDRDLSGDEEAVVDDVRCRTDAAVFSALEDGSWVVAAVSFYGIYRSLPDRQGTRLLYDTEPTETAAKERLEEVIARQRSQGLHPERYAWTVEPMPMSAEVTR